MIVHGFVQAGGGSTRFGTDKALVRLDGKTMLERTGELLASVCHDVTIVAAAGKYVDAPWPVIADRWPGQGPLGGILTALHYLRARDTADKTRDVERNPCSFALILSCDMPFLTTEFLRFLTDRALASEAAIIVPEASHRLEPLCACWCSASAAAIQAAFDAGGRKVTEAMKHVSMEVLDEADWKRFDTDGRLFWNMNTPADYEEAWRVLKERAARTDERAGPFDQTQGKQAPPQQG
ncbi:MAG TPA: molybdenum cofactor guanylyltransferase [Candidatus Sulfotelmatobacter sp.]|jgi:molybdopterin-guanine dinucleotide biosynthesis protein A|nr:molybdenum cofactor guanylyltransferase [Candidatus Sulfotelmatobacter sp.]